jgi:serine/threonine protein kinase
VAVDVARGLAFLHARSIADLDVKSPNVLLTPARSAKLADFGLARVLLTAATAVTACGSFDWAAPELLMGGAANKVSSAADIYSFGVILWELATREAPRRGRMRVPACAPAAPARRPVHERPLAPGGCPCRRVRLGRPRQCRCWVALHWGLAAVLTSVLLASAL